MKKIFQYMTTLLLLLVVGTSCEEGNDNWRIITDAQPGAYITGDATIYSATATSSQLVAAPLDGAPEGTNVVGIYTWLKSSGSFCPKAWLRMLPKRLKLPGWTANGFSRCIIRV